MTPKCVSPTRGNPGADRSRWRPEPWDLPAVTRVATLHAFPDTGVSRPVDG